MSTQPPNTVTMWTVVEWIYPVARSDHRYPKLLGSFFCNQEALKVITRRRAEPGAKDADLEVLGSYVDADQLAMIAHEQFHAKFNGLGK